MSVIRNENVFDKTKLTTCVSNMRKLNYPSDYNVYNIIYVI